MEEQRLQERIAWVRDRIAAASRRAGRDAGEVTLVAVSKTQPAEAVAAAYAAGLRVFGENRVEEAGPKAEIVARLVAPARPPEWHMVGHLQSRKAADVLAWAAMVHSVDSRKLAGRLSRAWLAATQEAGLLPGAGERDGVDGARPAQNAAPLPILLEVNVSGEASKYGFAPGEIEPALQEIAKLPGLDVLGLMTMAPLTSDPEAVRPVFAGLRLLRDELAQRHAELHLRHLSMGMTDDFEVAVEEGATIVRIGRAIFGERDQ